MSQRQAKVKVLLAEDHPVVRAGLAELLREEPNIELVGEACDGVEAVAMARQFAPDVIVMDISMPRLDGIEAIRRIHLDSPASRIIGLSAYESADMARAVHQAGVVAYLNKNEAADTLVAAVLEYAPPPAAI
jgi:DNA-binding NarL/FixJ family response regulator